MANVNYELGYNGIPFEDSILAFDTETSIDNDLNPGSINRLALIQVSNGTRTVLIHPSDLERFLCTHTTVSFVGHNIAYDFWIIEEYLRKVGNKDQIDKWWSRVEEKKLHDSMILDALIRLALGEGEDGSGEDKFYMRGLGDVAKSYTGIILDKKDPYRKRYVEIIGKRFSEVEDKGFWEYAAKDAYATYHTWIKLQDRAMSLIKRFANSIDNKGEDRINKWLQYGLLTEQIQIKGAIALQAIERTGMPFSKEAAYEDEQKWKPVVAESVKLIDKLRPTFFKKKNGRFEWATKSKVPKINQYDLDTALAESGLKIKTALPDFNPPQSSGKTFQEKGFAISRSADDWAPYKEFDPFLEPWIKLADVTKRLSFYNVFGAKAPDLFTETEPQVEHRARSRYDLLKRTGRTACKSFNLQQIPRDKDFRAIFKVPKGKKLLTIDYSAIELCTLASICLDKFGYSVLADVLIKGVDPHAYTAASMIGMKFEDFMELKKSNPNKFKEDRQKAKAINFGTPGGLGSVKLIAYAAANYGVHLTESEAVEFRRKLINDVYPELNDKNGYLADEFLQSVAINSGLSKGEIEVNLPCNGLPWVPRVLQKIVAGYTSKSNGEPYDSDFMNQCWDFWQKIGLKSPPDSFITEKSREKLSKRIGDPSLSRNLIMGTSYTLTGRIRGKVKYTILKNNGFQGLAADGIKLAMFELCKRGKKVVGMVHDELIIELNEDTAEEEAKEVESVMCTMMYNILGHGIPIKTEYHIEDFWLK